VAFDADMAEAWAKNEGKAVIMVRPETKPDDVHGMLAARGFSPVAADAPAMRRWWPASSANRRWWVRPTFIDLANRLMTIGSQTIHEGEWISIDGTAGVVYEGQLETMVPDIKDPWLIKLLSWADEFRTLGVWANADYPRDARRALEYGAEGIGLCRSEHMFFETDRLPHFQKA
jgi:pyruvate,orthophosphate dikinase